MKTEWISIKQCTPSICRQYQLFADSSSPSQIPEYCPHLLQILPNNIIVLQPFLNQNPGNLWICHWCLWRVYEGCALEESCRHHICQFFYTSTVSGFWKFTWKKRVNRDILNLKYYISLTQLELYPNFHMYIYIYVHYTHYQWVKHGLILLKLNHITSVRPKTDPQSELLPEW